ncbi:MAG: zinc-binding dehydrogenase [Xanthomonadales bacterium]|nr:zinc-binding dehydrogenase [Xanthomonadales bacterium]
MRGYRVTEFGGTEVMCWEELGELSPGPGQVLVAVRASAVNFAETRMRAGTYTGQELPFVMGMEAAGIVIAPGDGVQDFQPGDRVFGRARGSHAEQVLFDAEHLMPIPENLGFEQAAAIPVGWLTAWHALNTVVQAGPGDRVLIEAIGSSVGTAALQIALHRGCWVAGTASTDAKCQRALEAGAHAAYNYKTGDLRQAVAADTNGAGIDIGLMTIGQETADALLDVMGMDGRVVMYGSTGGRRVSFDLAIGTRNLQLLSMSISSSPRFVPDTMRSFREEALGLFLDGTFRSAVDVTLPMDQLVRAHEMIDERTHFGKIVLTRNSEHAA